MTATKYTYSILSDTLNNKISSDTLIFNIRESNISISFDYINTTGDILDIWFKDILDIDNQAILTSIVNLHDGVSFPTDIVNVAIKEDLLKKADSDGNLQVSMQPRLGSSLTIISHNFADPCTWYTNSIEVVYETLTTKVANTYDVYKCSNVNIIDSEHGRITFDSKMDPKYKIIVTVNDVVITTGYTFNYELGEITFITPLIITDVVKINYYYSTDNTFIIKPLAGKKVKIENVECQFSVDVDIANHFEFHFEEWGYNPNALPNKMLYGFVAYKNAKNFLDESNNTLSVIVPAFDNLTKEIMIFAWSYPAARVIKSSQGAEVRIKMKDIQNGNIITNPLLSKLAAPIEISSITFYCISETE